MKLTLAKISFITLIVILFTSCNVIKRVKKEDYLLTDNTVYVNDKKNNSEAVTNLLYQKPNGKLLGFPLRLHIYNLARPNIDSIVDSQINTNPKKKERLTKLLSQKQFDKYYQSKKDFNDWLKKTGEAPVIVNKLRTEKSIINLKKYYYNKGWFDVATSYEIKKDSNQRATIDYKVTTGEPYILDSITSKIGTPIIDTLYKTLKKKSLIQKGQQFDASNFDGERERLTTELRNSGLYYFGQDYIKFEIDTVGTNKKVNTEIQIQNRIIRNEDSIVRTPFKVYKIKDVNIYTDDFFENKDSKITDSTTYKNYNLYSYNKLKYRPKAITDAVFITKGNVFKDIDRSRTYRYLSELKIFKYPNIEYIENANDTTLTANIYLTPKKKYGLNIDLDITQSNIQTVGFSFSTGLLIRNIFRGAETLEISALGAIGASDDANNSKDQFFDINEVGANIKLTIPRMFFPVNTNKVIPKFMSPTTRIGLGATSQQNIGLDKQSFTGLLSYNWYPSRKVTNTLDLFNIQFVKNLNIDNYFGVYQNSFSRLNTIAQTYNTNPSYFDTNGNLIIPQGANSFITDALDPNSTLNLTDDDLINVSNISQRKNRLTENNLIFASSFNYVKNRRENLFDNDFSILRFRLELAGNLLSNISSLAGLNKNSDNRYEVFGVAFSQYAKTEFDYVKYWDLGKRNVFAVRSYFGIAIPYGNSNSIPFSKSFFAGGANDNRAWTAYNLGPGSSNSTNEFNEANLKLHFSAEQRFNIFGSFNGALFVDAGNIWNVFDNITDESYTFNGLNSLKDIAIGSGFGLRYDFNYFIFRLDVGFKTYDPSNNINNRWFKNYNFNKAVYNFGINYPF